MGAARKRDDFEGEALRASAEAARARLATAEDAHETQRFYVAAAMGAVDAATEAREAFAAMLAEAEAELAHERDVLQQSEAGERETLAAVQLAKEGVQECEIALDRHFGDRRRG